MQLTDKGQVTIPKHILVAARLRAGSEVKFALEAGRIVISKVSTRKKGDRRARLLAAAARARASMPCEFQTMCADDIVEFVRPGRPSHE